MRFNRWKNENNIDWTRGFLFYILKHLRICLRLCKTFGGVYIEGMRSHQNCAHNTTGRMFRDSKIFNCFCASTQNQSSSETHVNTIIVKGKELCWTWTFWCDAIGGKWSFLTLSKAMRYTLPVITTDSLEKISLWLSTLSWILKHPEKFSITSTFMIYSI